MNFSNPIPRAVQPKFHEGSALRSVRDSDASSRQWLKNRAVSKSNDAIGRAISKMSQDIAKIRRPRPPGFPAQDDVVVPDFYFPFKIYKPSKDNVDFYTPGSTGTTFNDITGKPITCAIDATVPTSLPTTVNPLTDWWRFWAVRNGMVSFRPYLSSSYDNSYYFNPTIIAMDDFSMAIELDQNAGCDSIGTDSYSSYGFNFLENDAFPANDSYINPIIIPGPPADMNGHSGTVTLAIYVRISMLSADTLPSASLYAQRINYLSQPFPSAPNSQTIPLGIIDFPYDLAGGSTTGPYGLDTAVKQFQNGHILPGHGILANYRGIVSTVNTLFYSSALNYRGDFLHDDNLASLIFYPGDVVRYEKTFEFTAHSTGGISTNVNITDDSGLHANPTVYGQNLYLMTTTGFTSDPSTDSNWTLISGFQLSSITTPTPNT